MKDEGVHRSALECTIMFICSGAPTVKEKEKGQPYKDWVFINYTFKRFEGLTQRGVPNARDVVKHSELRQ